MPVNSQDIDFIASLLTDNPDIVREPAASARPRTPQVVAEGRLLREHGFDYEADEVPLIPDLPAEDPGQILGYVKYEVEYDMHGRYIPGDWYNPPEYPEAEITGVTAEIVAAYDFEGNEVPITPEMEQAAITYFDNKLADKALDKAYEEAYDRTYNRAYDPPDYDDY